MAILREHSVLTMNTEDRVLTKGEIIRTGMDLGVDYGLTVSCYQATEDGLACGRCDSCRLRRQGFIDAGVEDTTRYLQ